MLKILLLLTWFIPIFINAWMDRKGAKRDYVVVFIFRGIAAILHAVLVQVTGSYYDVADYLPLFIFQVTSFWIFFELILNYLRDNPAFYYDRREKDSGWIDRFFTWAGPGWHLVAKAMCFIVMVLSVIVIYHQ